MLSTAYFDNIRKWAGVDDGNPGYGSITAKVFVRADADEDTLKHIWKLAVEGSPVTQSVMRETKVTAEFEHGRLVAVFVSADWVEERLGTPDYLVIDTRSAMRYLMGHLKSAVSVPQRKLLDPQGRLLPAEDLACLFSEAVD